MGCNHKIYAFVCLSIIVLPNDTPHFIYPHGLQVNLRNFYAYKLRISSTLSLIIALCVIIINNYHILLNQYSHVLLSQTILISCISDGRNIKRI